MKLFEDLLGITELKKTIQQLESKQSAVDTLIVNSTYGEPHKAYEKYESYVKEGYFKNSVVASGIEYIGSAVGGIEWHAKKGDKVVEDSDLIKLLIKPNPFVKNRAEFFKKFILYLYLSGNEYMQKAPLGKRTDTIKELYNLRPDRTEIIKGDGMQRVKGYKYKISSSSKAIALTREDVMHIKFTNPIDDWYGITPLKSVEYEIDETNEAHLWNYHLLKDGGMPPGIILFNRRLDKDQKTEIRNSIKEQYGGGKNAGKWMVLGDSQNVSAKLWGFSPIAMQWLDGMNHNAVQIALRLGVPPELLGIQGQKTYSNYKEARKSFYTETILPLMDWIQGALNGFLSDYFDGQKLEYDKDDIEALAEDRTRTFADANLGYSSGLLMKNEGRKLIQYPTVPDGDQFKLLPGGLGYMSLNKMELKTLAGIDINTDEKKDIYWKSQEMNRKKWIAIVEKLVTERLEEEKKEIVQAIKDNKKPEEGINEDKWLDTLKKIYTTVGSEFALGQSRKIKSLYFMETKSFDKNFFDTLMLKYLKRNGMKKVKIIKETVKTLCISQLAEGVKNGESIPQLAKRLNGKIEDIIPNRATIIARTETVQAANAGNHFGAEESGVKVKKTWLTTRDGRERDWHGEVDGQERDMDKPFDVPNSDGMEEQLAFPLDTSYDASGSNIIQCRCVETYTPI